MIASHYVTTTGSFTTSTLTGPKVASSGTLVKISYKDLVSLASQTEQDLYSYGDRFVLITKMSKTLMNKQLVAILAVSIIAIGIYAGAIPNSNAVNQVTSPWEGIQSELSVN